MEKMQIKFDDAVKKCDKLKDELAVAQGKEFSAEKEKNFIFEKGREIKKLCQDKIQEIGMCSITD
jgi:hypothetical protein